MKKVNENGENMEVLEMDVKRKEEVKKELDYCKSTLENEFDHLYTYQEGFFYWVNTKKDIVDSMKKNLQVGELEDILRFCDYRNHFLVKKCIQMKKYITNINRIITFFDSIDEIEEIESIDVKLRMMLISLCLELPVEVFGEPY